MLEHVLNPFAWHTFNKWYSFRQACTTPVPICHHYDRESSACQSKDIPLLHVRPTLGCMYHRVYHAILYITYFTHSLLHDAHTFNGADIHVLSSCGVILLCHDWLSPSYQKVQPTCPILPSNTTRFCTAICFALLVGSWASKCGCCTDCTQQTIHICNFPTQSTPAKIMSDVSRVISFHGTPHFPHLILSCVPTTAPSSSATAISSSLTPPLPHISPMQKMKVSLQECHRCHRPWCPSQRHRMTWCGLHSLPSLTSACCT